MKRKFTINVTKGYIITAIIFLLGVVVLILGLLSFLKGRNAISVSELYESQLKSGQYVKGVIREYMGYYEDPEDEETFHSSYGATSFGIGVFYWEYTIKTADGKYITLMVNEEDNKLVKELNSYIGGKGNSAYFEGKVVKALPGDEMDESWYQKALGIESKEEIDEVVISDYFILQDSFEVDTKKISIGFLLIVVSIAYFFFSGGVKGLLVYWDEEEESE